MAERKVLNKYYPPDFDPNKLRTIEKKNTHKICNVRMMLPMTMKCYSCNNYMYIGTKFNMKVEPVTNEYYLGIQIYRFCYRCSNCFNEITFKTDPKNNDYIAEKGGSRHLEPWKDMLLAEEEFKNEKKKEMKEDAMKNLEYRTYDSKREMEILEATDKVKELNKREENIDYDFLMEKIKEKKYKNNYLDENDKEQEDDTEQIKKMFQELKKNKNNGPKNIFENSNNGKGEMFFLKKKVMREESEDEDKNNINSSLKIKNKKDKLEHFLSSSDDEDKSDNNKNVKDIFKKPLLKFSKSLNKEK